MTIPSTSLMENLTKVAAVLGAFVALGQTGSEAIRGFWQQKAEQAKAAQELELTRLKENSKLAQDYIQLIMNKDVAPQDRIMLLGALSEIKDHPLQKWAQERHAGILKNLDAINKAREAQIRAVSEKDDNERKAMSLEAEIAVLNEQISLERENVDQSGKLQEYRRQKAKELARVRAVVGLAAVRVETRTTVVVRTEAGSSALDASDKASEMTRLIDKIDAQLLLTVFPPAAEANINKYLPFVKAALQEFRVSDRRMVAAILATILVETGNFAPSSAMVGQNVPFRGRGFILMTGQQNYALMSRRLGLGTLLVDSPDEANNPEIAARILCAFFVDREKRLLDAFERGDAQAIHRIVLGGQIPTRFVPAYEKLLAQLATP